MFEQVRLEAHGDDVRLWIKVVPGASRAGIAGVLGDRLRIRVSAPPEGGKANRAVCELIARVLGLKRSQLTIESGHSTADKTIRLTGAAVTSIRDRLNAAEKQQR